MYCSRATLRISVICGAVIVVGTGAPARAQSTIPSDAVYNDVKQIIEDLISREAAHTVTPHLACLSGRIAAETKDAGAVTFAIDPEGKSRKTYVLEATKLFPRTMQSIYDGQYGKLGPIISDEASGAVAYALYHLLTLPTLVRAVQQSAQEAKDLTAQANRAARQAHGVAEMVRAKKALAQETAEGAVKAANNAVAALANNDPATALTTAADAAAATQRALVAAEAPAAQSERARVARKRIEAAAAAVEEAKAMTSGALVAKPAPAMNEAAAQAALPGTPDFALLPDYAVETCSRALTTELDNRLIGDGPSALDAACGAGDVAGDVDSSIKEYACDISYAVKHVITNDVAGAEGYLLKAIAETVRALYTVGNAQPAPSPVAVRTALVPIINELMSGLNNPAQAVADARKALAALSAQLKKGEEEEVTRYLTRARDLWLTVHMTGHDALSIAEFANGIAVAAATNACVTDPTTETAKPAICQVIVIARDKLRFGEQLWPIIRAASSGNEVDAAERAIGMVFAGLKGNCDAATSPAAPASLASTKRIPPAWALPKKGPTASMTLVAPEPEPTGHTTEPRGESASTCKTFHFYEELVDAVVVYVYQAETRRVPTDEARSVLRTTAERLIEEVGVNGGIDRAPWSSLAWFWPDLVLRYQWSGSYANGTNGTGRFTAALPMLKFRKRVIYYRLSYVSATLSLVDPLAPLAEIADRPPGLQYTNAGSLWWNVISPRFDISVGVPALSKHLLVGGGVAFRPVALERPTSASPSNYGSCKDNWGWSDCLEFGLYVKYAI